MQMPLKQGLYERTHLLLRFCMPHRCVLGADRCSITDIDVTQSKDSIIGRTLFKSAWMSGTRIVKASPILRCMC